MLPRLFFEYFRPTSFVAESVIDGRLVGFVCGFVSQTDPREAYVHFAGVDPDSRGSGLGRRLYEEFFAAARERGCSVVRAVTSPANTGSIAFHVALGFEVAAGVRDFDGPGEHRVRLGRSLT
jgi:ribosomal protein S18 acetylase RimI-like enzyme